MAHSSPISEFDDSMALRRFLEEGSCLLSDILPLNDLLRTTTNNLQVEIAQQAPIDSCLKALTTCLGAIAGLTIPLALEITDERALDSLTQYRYLATTNKTHEEVLDLAHFAQRLYQYLKSGKPVLASTDVLLNFRRDLCGFRVSIRASLNSYKLLLPAATGQKTYWAESFVFVFVDLCDVLLALATALQNFTMKCAAVRPSMGASHTDERNGSAVFRRKLQPKDLPQIVLAPHCALSNRVSIEMTSAVSPKTHAVKDTVTVLPQNVSHDRPNLDGSPTSEAWPNYYLRQHKSRKWVQFAFSTAGNNANLELPQPALFESPTATIKQDVKVDSKMIALFQSLSSLEAGRVRQPGRRAGFNPGDILRDLCG